MAWCPADLQSIKLLGECSTLGGKRFVNETIGVIIERVGDKIMPYLPSLAQAIPGLCELRKMSVWQYCLL